MVEASPFFHEVVGGLPISLNRCIDRFRTGQREGTWELPEEIPNPAFNVSAERSLYARLTDEVVWPGGEERVRTPDPGWVAVAERASRAVAAAARAAADAGYTPAVVGDDECMCVVPAAEERQIADLLKERIEPVVRHEVGGLAAVDISMPDEW